MNQYKHCSQCKQELSFDSFHKCKANSTGRKSACKSCLKIEAAAYKKANPEKVRQSKSKWNSANKEKKRLTQALYRQDNKEKLAEYSKRYASEHKAQRNINNKKYRVQNQAKESARKKRYALENPTIIRSASSRRRALLLGAKTFLVTDKEIAALYRLPCFYCGDKAQHLDHVIPLSRGGTHGIGNLVPACLFCNSSKHDKYVTEWKKVKGLFALNLKKGK
jgi:5-methylcytosine-specific restriction endonuclease McrA